jgi:hypothetical protein
MTGIAFWTGMGYEVAGRPELMPDATTVYHLRKAVHLRPSQESNTRTRP